MITDPLFFALAIPAVIALGLSKGGFAGVGQVATPLLALLLPPLQAAALLLPIMMVQDAMSVWVYRRQWSAWNLKVMLPGAIAGICLAWALASSVSDAFVRLGVGLISLAYVLNAWIGKPPADARRPSAAGGIFWGTVSGFTSTMAQAGGPPFQIHVLPQRLEKLTYVGTNVMFFAVVNAVKVGPYFALGNFTPEFHDLSGAVPARRGVKPARRMAGAAGAHRDLLQDRPRSDLPDLTGTDPLRRVGFAALGVTTPADCRHPKRPLGSKPQLNRTPL